MNASCVGADTVDFTVVLALLGVILIMLQTSLTTDTVVFIMSLASLPANTVLCDESGVPCWLWQVVLPVHEFSQSSMTSRNISVSL